MSKVKRWPQMLFLMGLIFLFLGFMQQDDAAAFQTLQTPASEQFMLSVEAEEIQYLQEILALGGIDDQTRDALEEKLDMAQNIVSERRLSNDNWSVRAERIQPPSSSYAEKPFLEGIFEGGEGFISSSEAFIYNYWQDAADDGYIQVFAGSSAKNPLQGVIYIVHTSVDRLDTKVETVYSNEEDGGLRIFEMKDGILFLKSQNMLYCFDVLKRQFVCAVN